jgi:beta-mannosidase
MPTNYYNMLKLKELIVLLLLTACSYERQADLLPETLQKPMIKTTLSLNSESSTTWTLYFGPQDENAPQNPVELKKSKYQHIDATVPGNVEIDLLKAGLIEDPMKGDHVYDLRKFETYNWWYRRNFIRPECKQGERVELCFDGIDCIADIWLNNRKIAHIENMFVEHHYDITDVIEKHNELYVYIYSTLLEARKHIRNNFGVRYDALAEAVNIRKAQHMFGWDILPRLLSAGIWKEVKLEVIPSDYWQSIYWVTRNVNVKNKTADLYVDWQFNTRRLNIDDLTLKISLSKDNRIIFEKKLPVYTACGRERISGLKDVEFWWPRGFGQQALYEARLQLCDSTGKVLSENMQPIGIRKIDLVLTDINTPEIPGEFYFRVNGERVFIKGTNWVALDALHSRDIQHLDTAMAMLADLNCNMVRLWGGNVYENNAFYDLCDQNGIMVWQDFTMGCTTYPQNAEFQEKIRKEAQKVIIRLRNHACMALWAGNNENDVSLEWGDEQSYINPNTDIISRQVLPLAVREWDPKTPYLPSSPFISSAVFDVEKRINSNLSPEMHLWGPRGYYKASFYTENHAKFVSEIGYHGCPNLESLQKMMDKDFIYPWTNVDTISGKTTTAGSEIDGLVWNDQWQCKATCSHPSAETNKQRNHLLTNQIKCVFGEVPTDLRQFITASQIVQAEAMKYFIEFWRMNKGDRNGILWWNLRDGWPIISDAIVDYYGSKKLAYHFIKQVQTDVCVMMGDPENAKHPVIAVNDTRRNVPVSITIKDAGTGQTVLRRNLTLPENGKASAGFIPVSGSTKMFLIEWEAEGKKYVNHYLSYKPPISLDEYLKWLLLLVR